MIDPKEPLADINISGLLRKAQVDTVDDAIELLQQINDLKPIRNGAITDMITRLENMKRSL